ncbi:MAG: hypothetical protein QXL51_00360 [Candidatus Aenigmatarchaeota archaeon]
MPPPIIYIKVLNLLVYNRFYIRWESLESNIVSFNIYRSTSPVSGFEKIATVPATQKEYVDQVPFNFHLTYYYKITQVDNNGVESSLDEAIAGSDKTFTSWDEVPFIKYPVDSSYVFNQPVIGEKNGVNTLFKTIDIFRAGSLCVYLNGVRQTLNVDYREGEDLQSFIFQTIIPISSDDIVVDYIKLR